MGMLVCLHPEEIRALLVSSSLYDVKASFFHDHFVVQYSDQGSNSRTAEEAVMLNFAEYINECASGIYTYLSFNTIMLRYSISIYPIPNLEFIYYSLIAFFWNSLCIGNGPVKLGDILEFVSGASKIPPSGFPRNPSIRFCDDDRLATASTCDVSITFPRKLGWLQFDQFKETMDLCILGSCGFGNV